MTSMPPIRVLFGLGQMPIIMPTGVKVRLAQGIGNQHCTCCTPMHAFQQMSLFRQKNDNT